MFPWIFQIFFILTNWIKSLRKQRRERGRIWNTSSVSCCNVGFKPLWSKGNCYQIFMDLNHCDSKKIVKNIDLSRFYLFSFIFPFTAPHSCHRNFKRTWAVSTKENKKRIEQFDFDWCFPRIYFLKACWALHVNKLSGKNYFLKKLLGFSGEVSRISIYCNNRDVSYWNNNLLNNCSKEVFWKKTGKVRNDFRTSAWAAVFRTLSVADGQALCFASWQVRFERGSILDYFLQ